MNDESSVSSYSDRSSLEGGAEAFDLPLSPLPTPDTPTSSAANTTTARRRRPRSAVAAAAPPRPNIKEETTDNRHRKRAKIVDLRELVQYLVLVGHDHRQRQQQLQQQPTERRGMPRTAATAASKAPASSSAATATNTSSVVHVEDTLLYGQTSGIPQAWPTTKKNRTSSTSKTTTIDDTAWETLYGDDTGTVSTEFSDWKLSQQNYNPPPTTEPTTAVVPPPPAVRSVLLQCWHRAVHQASQTMCISTAPATDNSKSKTNQHNPPPAVANNNDPQEHEASSEDEGSDHGVNLEQDDDSSASSADGSHPNSASNLAAADATAQKEAIQNMYGPDPARTMCQRLQLTLEGFATTTAPSHACPHCGLSCTDHNSLEEHYYGKPNARGCCWSLIRQRQTQWLRTTLEQEVLLQGQQLVQLVATRSLDAVVESSPINPPPRTKRTNSGGKVSPAAPSVSTITTTDPPLDWRHIHDIVQSVVQTAVAVEHGTGAVSLVNGEPTKIETIEAKLSLGGTTDGLPPLPPIPLNQHVLQATTTRLYQRYHHP